MRDFWKVLGFVLAMALAAGIVLFFIARDADGSEPDAVSEQQVQGGTQDSEWEAWEKKAAATGAGEQAPPMPDEEMTDHEAWCKNIPGWCPTVTNGVAAGKTWCLGKPNAKKKPTCYYSHRNRSYDIMLEWWDWLKMFMGGKHPIYKAGTIRTESEGVWDAMTASSTKECGLASVDLAKAEKYNINACDPKANLWAAGQMTNARLLALRSKYPQLVMAPLSDQWKLAGACGAIGSNKVWNLIDSSGALRVKDDGTLFYAHPHERVLKWLQWADNNPKFDFYSYGVINFLGRNPGRGAFRVARSVAQETLFEDIVGGLDNLYGEPVLVARPPDLYEFPGKAKHCKCHLWPELADHKPVPVKSVPGITDPRVLDE